MREFKPFMMNTFAMPILQQRAQIINDLTRYMTHSWRDVYRGDMDPRAEVFRQAAQGAMSRHFFEYHDMTDKVRAKMRQPGDTIELVLDAFEKAIRLDEAEHIAIPHFLHAGLVQKFGERFGQLPYDARVISVGEEEQPSVLGAYRMACNNFSQAQTRRLSYTVLQILLQHSEYNSCAELAEGGALLSHLYGEISAAMKDMLLFAGLLGGQAQAQTIKRVAREMCHKENEDGIQFGIMHFITADRRSPGIYATAASEAFRADIKAKYEAL